MAHSTVHASTPRLSAGTLLAQRYRIQREIGSGGMGVVYRALDTKLDEVVALKQLRLSQAEEAAVRRFHRELKLARRITHPNVARVHDLGEHEGMLFMTMELIDGHSLESLLHPEGAAEGTRLEPIRAIELTLPIARGLAAAHEAGVVHRDLKPANVLVEGGGRVVLTDFGIARSMLEGGAETTDIVGTPFYMAPEQVVGDAVDARTDIYALGLLLYEMLVGKMPFAGPTPMAAVVARCKEPPPDPRRSVNMPDPLAKLVLACMATDPRERPATAEQVAESLVQLIAANANTVSATSVSDWRGLVTSTPISSPFAPVDLSLRTLAVMPFAYRGPPDDSYLGDAFSQELIDVLSRTRDLRVMAFGATQPHRDTDPREAGRALKASYIVAGSVSKSGQRLRIDARLVDVLTGVQMWSDRFDDASGDVLELQEIVCQRIANALRVEVDIDANRSDVTPPALEHYLRARKVMQASAYMRADEVVEHLDRCLELSPGFTPAIAAHAVVSVRAWWKAMMDAQATDYRARVMASVERAKRHAPDCPETHLAAGMAALQLGDLQTTARELSTALELSPTMPEAHRYLGEIQVEAGRLEEGVKHLRLATELDPSLYAALSTMARASALRGDFATAHRQLTRLENERGVGLVPALAVRVRLAVWQADEAGIAAARDRCDKHAANPGAAYMAAFCRFILGDLDEQLMLAAGEMIRSTDNVRFAMLYAQLATEGYTLRGEYDKALAALTEAANDALVDVAWMELCPALAPIRDDQRFKDASVIVGARAEDIWHIE